MAKNKEKPTATENLVPYNFPAHNVTIMAVSMEDALARFEELGLTEENN